MLVILLRRRIIAVLADFFSELGRVSWSGKAWS